MNNISQSTIFIAVVIIFSLYLIYSQYAETQNYMKWEEMMIMKSHTEKPKTEPTPVQREPTIIQQPPTHVTIDPNYDPYADPIKRQDIYTMHDPLAYPTMRLPREVLEKYNDYYMKHGSYPPWGLATQPYLFDNPVQNGLLIKILDNDTCPFDENVPSSVPLFRVKSVKNANRFFYHIIDPRYFSKIEQKIPLDNIRINGVKYENADFYGVPELFDEDIITDISVFPGAKFKVQLYKQYHFP